MKIIILVIGLGFMLFSVPEYKLIKGKAGEFWTGMSPDEVYEIAGKENIRLVDQFLEGYYSPAFIVHEPDEQIPIILEIDCDKIYRISVLNPKYKTIQNIGVKNTFGELKQRHNVTEIIRGEGNVVAYVSDLNMSFGLDVRKIGDQEPTLSSIKDDVQIVNIYVLLEKN